jgi:hypothetical protein
MQNIILFYILCRIKIITINIVQEKINQLSQILIAQYQVQKNQRKNQKKINKMIKLIIII